MVARVSAMLFLACLVPLTLFGWPGGLPPPLRIKAIPATNVYVIGESMPVTIEVTNTHTRAEIGFTWQVAGDRTSGVTIELMYLDGGSRMQFTGRGMGGCGEGWIRPNTVAFNSVDLARAFNIEQSGRYSLCVRYREQSVRIVLGNDGKEVGSELHKEMDIQSDLVEIKVVPPNPEQITEIDRLLRSEADKDVEEAGIILTTARPGVYRRELPSLWNVIRTRQQPVKNQALKVFLSRIDLADDRVSDDELFSELAVASTDQDPSLRVAVAESLSRLHALGARRQSLNRFVVQRVPKWFDGETSPACRAMLVGRLPVPKSERLVTIVQQDADPQVRAAAIQRLIELDPHRFLESAETFTNLAGEVTIEGRSLSLGSLVESEKDRVRRTLRTDEDRGATPPPK